jgi:hypothetical protein
MKIFTLVFASLVAVFGLAASQEAPVASNIAGKWHFVLDTEGGPRESEAMFELQGKQVTGKWGTANAAGTFENNALDLEFPYTSDEVGAGTMKIKGKLVDDKLSGTWAFQSYDGTFKATRTK